MNKQKLIELKQTIFEGLGEYSKAYASDLHSGNIEDSKREFAANYGSVYAYDQKAYYYDHAEQCNNALLLMGYGSQELGDYLGSGHDLGDLVAMAGSIGEEVAIYEELDREGDEISELYLVNELLRREAYNIESDKLGEMLNESHIYRYYDDIDDIINEALEESEE